MNKNIVLLFLVSITPSISLFGMNNNKNSNALKPLLTALIDGNRSMLEQASSQIGLINRLAAGNQCPGNLVTLIEQNIDSQNRLRAANAQLIYQKHSSEPNKAKIQELVSQTDNLGVQIRNGLNSIISILQPPTV